MTLLTATAWPQLSIMQRMEGGGVLLGTGSESGSGEADVLVPGVSDSNDVVVRRKSIKSMVASMTMS
jgi:hypothetical protein